MRLRKPKAKAEREVVFPPHLVEFLREVANSADAPEDDEPADSDDLFRTGFAYGRFEEEADDVFTLTFFPESGSTRHKWELWLTSAELDAVAAGDLTGIKMWFCRTPGCRSGFRNPNDTCFYCDWEDPPSGGRT